MEYNSFDNYVKGYTNTRNEDIEIEQNNNPGTKKKI